MRKDSNKRPSDIQAAAVSPANGMGLPEGAAGPGGSGVQAKSPSKADAEDAACMVKVGCLCVHITYLLTLPSFPCRPQLGSSHRGEAE